MKKQECKRKKVKARREKEKARARLQILILNPYRCQKFVLVIIFIK